MLPLPPLAARIRAADPNADWGEAALTVAGFARSRADAHQLLAMLGLENARTYKWDVARVARVIVACGRGSRPVSANTLRPRLPARARPLIPTTVREMRTAGLLAPAGKKIRSASPGAGGRLVPVWQLTAAGEVLARDTAPWAGEEPARVPLLELATLP